jgi:ankyrin repeat protein
MKRTVICLAVFSFHFAGCNGSPSQNANPAAAGSGQTTGNPVSKPSKSPQEAITEAVAKPLAEAARGLIQANAGLFEQIAKQRKITPLHQAASDNKTTEAKRLLAAGADVNARDIDGSTPLHYAARAFGADVIPVLLAAGADINARDKDGATPLHVAMVFDNGGKGIPYLLKAKADLNAVDHEGCTPLLYALRWTNTERAKQLIAAGADVNRCPKNGVGPLHWACRGDAELVDLLIAAGAKVNATTDGGKTPLHYAAQFRQSGIVAALLKAKADPNARDKKGWSPLAIAADAPDLETAAALRRAGAKEPSWTPLDEAVIFESPKKVAALLKEKPNVNAVDAFGRTPLYWALRCADNKTADLLVDAGAELTNADKSHASILPVAVWADRMDIAKKATAAGADVNATDDEGCTALHWAAAGDNLEAVEVLLKNGAKINAACNSGETPLILALQSRKPELVKRLLDAGANALAVDGEGKSIERELWKIHDHKIADMLEKAVADATEKRIDRICYLYSADNPKALKAAAVEPTTPNLAAVKMYRALFGPDKKAFAAMFVGGEQQMAAVNALYDFTHDYVAFRKELTKAFGPDACQRFNALRIDNRSWSFTLMIVDQDRLERIKVDIQGDQAVCHDFPELRQTDVRFLKQGGAWRIDAAFLTPAAQPDAYLRLFGAMSRTTRRGQALLRQPGSRMEDVKRAMGDEFEKLMTR